MAQDSSRNPNHLTPRVRLEMLKARHGRKHVGEQSMSTVREELGVPDVTSHSFRKTVVTLIDDEGLSARIAADQVGHSKVSMTQDKYMARSRVHTEVANLLDRTIDDE